MRVQDVKLMKQLININRTIQSLTRHRLRSEHHKKVKNGPRVVSTTEFSRMATPLVRQQSAPSYKLYRKDSVDSNSSFEDTESSLEDVSEEPYSENEDYLNASTQSLPAFSTFPKSHSVCYMTPLPDDGEEVDNKLYEGILMTNIKLWKYSNKEKLGTIRLQEYEENMR
ncbi:hypothetical protein FSP39_008517 [Pinctada imbricata]|uniref:Uncharacterized protein n=1 Tax=Pinctada imbricata TaxID=66713 RepID=A0AA89C6W4_PINIB|nr:hypothetical protein FSP39_008517 [Pinctada imbricata]